MKMIKLNKTDRQGFIVLNRPEKRNALSPQLIKELHQAFEEMISDDQVKVIVLAAEGKVFCAGADLAYLQELQDFDYNDNLEDSLRLRNLFHLIYTSPKPVIARVHGHAIAGGAGLLTVCDFVIMDEQAKFGFTEVKIGFIPALVMVFLGRKIGESRALQLLLSGELISAAETRDLGLVWQMGSADQLDAKISTLANQLISGNSGESMASTKHLLQQVYQLPLDQALDHAAEANAKSRLSQDCRKGIQSFLNKEELKW